MTALTAARHKMTRSAGRQWSESVFIGEREWVSIFWRHLRAKLNYRLARASGENFSFSSLQIVSSPDWISTVRREVKRSWDFFFVFFHDVCRLNSFIVSAFVDLSVKRDFSFAWWTPMWVSAYWLYVVNLIKSVGAQSKKWKTFDLPNRMKFIDQTCCEPTEAQKTFPHMKLPQLAAKSPLVSSFFTQKRRIAKAFSGKENFFVWRWKMEKHFT